MITNSNTMPLVRIAAERAAPFVGKAEAVHDEI